MAPIKTIEMEGRRVRVKPTRVPCRGGPLKYLSLHEPFDKTVPLVGGKYRLVEDQHGKPYYDFEPDARRR